MSNSPTITAVAYLPKINFVIELTTPLTKEIKIGIKITKSITAAHLGSLFFFHFKIRFNLEFKSIAILKN